MSLALDNTVMGTVGDGTNSYCDVPYAEAYFAGHWNGTYITSWDALSAQAKAGLLIASCRVIETARFTVPLNRNHATWHSVYNRLTFKVMNFELQREPVKFYFYQALQFPRNLDIDPVSGDMFIPEAILMAQCEQAMYTLGFDQTALSNRMQGVVTDSISVGRGQIHINQQYGMEGSMYAPMALEMIKPYLVRGVRVRRG